MPATQTITEQKNKEQFLLRSLNKAAFDKLDITCIVVDDDPTGSQTVYGIPVLGEWTERAIVAEFEQKTPVFYILSNSRSKTKEEVEILAAEIGGNIKKASAKTGRNFLLVSRSDSTLRGHFPIEVTALSRSVGYKDYVTFLIPVMFEGGRVTKDDTHFLIEQEKLIPVAETPFALDKVFGYKNSNLKHWIEEKTAGQVRADDVVSITLEDIHEKGVEGVKTKLNDLRPGSICIVNALTYQDLDVFTNACISSLDSIKYQIVFRTSSSFVPSFIGLEPKEILTKTDLNLSASAGALIIVGSYVPKSSAQLSYLINNHQSLESIELNVEELLSVVDDKTYFEEIAHQIDQLILSGKDVVLFTSRKLVIGDKASENLSIGNTVSQGFINIVTHLKEEPKYLLAKGGITSNDIAVKGLGMERSMVRGQILPGIPVWEMGNETQFPGLVYIVFPGNVGDEKSLYDIIDKLT